MSLRMSSLDPNEPRAAKDCRVCNRRRIRCDRSLPTCKKCALKDLTCPGYGLRIQFGQGVASRGKLMGKTLPVIEAAPPAPPSSYDANTASPESVTPIDRLDQEPSSLWPERVPMPTAGPITDHNAFQFNNPYALNIDLSHSVLPPYLQGRPVRELFHYYDHHVTTLMPWVDGGDNPWRTLMIPLALKSESLLLALLALSAEHYSSMSGSKVLVDNGFLSSTYRDKSLKLLARDLQAEIDEDASSARQIQASGILATILFLCNLEMIRCETGTWHVHWKAARTITRRWTAPHLTSTILDNTCRFLLKEAFVYDVFGSSTTFGDTDQISGSFLTDHDADAFTDWEQLIQEVTCTERRRATHSSQYHDLPAELSNMEILEQRFQHARARGRRFCESSNFSMPGNDQNFLILIDIFHFAGLAYSISTLFGNQDPAVLAAIAINVNAVMNTLAQIEHVKAFHHNLVWPTFVVGTQGRHDLGTQEFARTTLSNVMDSTNFSNCRPALEFLQRFWASDPSIVADWMQFAREDTQQGRHFLVI